MLISSLKSALNNYLWNIRNSSYKIASGDSILDKDIKIFVITHKDKPLPDIFDNHNVYIPLRVGNMSNPTIHKDWLTDDSGENISEYNALINEITGIWWVAKHYQKLGNPSFVGFNHYRRFLQWHPTLLEKNTLISTSGTYFHTLYHYWKNSTSYYYEKDIADKFRNAFLNTFKNTEYCDYDKYMNSHTLFYSNLFITDRETFFSYFSFLEKCLELVFEMMKNNAINLRGVSPYRKRIYSFFLEHMTSYWIFHGRQKKFKHITTMETYFNIPNMETSLH